MLGCGIMGAESRESLGMGATNKNRTGIYRMSKDFGWKVW
jgi:hypothetical protein